ncbi:unnamed protein product [Durusdinium trenchii]|uniref:Uncharacterized protein n=2 Tax=Durusdinium trenchii TaxID=1381693 RepID=A0ABP0KQ03_9DINO
MAVNSWAGCTTLLLALLLDSVTAARHRQDQTKNWAMAMALAELESGMVPGAVNRALKAASRSLDARLDELKEKQQEAETKKVSAASALQKKLALVDDVNAKTKAVEAKAKSKRDAMVAVEKAATAHTESGKAHQDAVEKRNKLSQDVEDLDVKITEKNTAMMKALQKMKNEIEDLKDQRDKKVQERDSAEHEQLDLKGKVMAATKFKAGVQQEQVKAEKAVQDAQQELDELQASLDNAVTDATVAEVADTEAADKLRDAKKQADRANRMVKLIEQLKQSIKTYYKSVDDLDDDMMDRDAAGLFNINEASVDQLMSIPSIGRKRAEKIVAHREQHGPFHSREELMEVYGIGPILSSRISEYVTFQGEGGGSGGEPWNIIKTNPLLKTAYKNYNLMVNVFMELHAFDDETYQKVKPATKEIDENSFTAIYLACDPDTKFGKIQANNTELDKVCGSGLWDAVGITRSTFP